MLRTKDGVNGVRRNGGGLLTNDVRLVNKHAVQFFRRKLLITTVVLGIIVCSVSAAQAASQWTVREIKELETLSDDADIVDMAFISATDGWIIAAVWNETTQEDDMKVLHTTDGGDTWTIVFPGPQYTPAVSYFDIDFDEMGNFGVLLHHGNNTIDQGLLVTTNGGINWSNRNIPAFTWQFYAVETRWPSYIWLVGADPDILYSNTGGASWTSQTSPTGSGGACIHVDEDDVIFLGGWGVISGAGSLYTSNAYSGNWLDVSANIPYMSEIDFVMTNGIGSIGISQSGTIYYSGYPPEGGTWPWTAATLPETMVPRNVDMVTTWQGWAVGRNSFGMIRGKIYKTEDYGVTWTIDFDTNSILGPLGEWSASIYTISMVNTTLGYAGGSGDGAYLFKYREANTKTGSNKTVSPHSDVTITYGQVTGEGETTVTTEDCSVGPSGFKILPMDSPTCYNVITTATHTGTTEICIKYDDTGITNESALKLFHYDWVQEVWTDITTSIDTTQNILCGQTTGFSKFAVVIPVPPNDDCSNATVISDGTYFGYTIDATNDGTATCGLSDTTADVWYAYVPSCSGPVSVNLCDSDYDTVLSVHSGCPGTAENQIAGACNDDCTGVGVECFNTLQSCLIFTATAGQPYWIRISGYNGQTETFVLNVDSDCIGCWSCPGQPYGDTNGDGATDFGDLINLKKAFNTTVTGSPHGTGPGEYNCCVDFDQNGAINFSEVIRLKQYFGQTGLGACTLTTCP